MVIHLCHVCAHMAGYDYGTGMATIDNGRFMRRRLLLVSRVNFLFTDSVSVLHSDVFVETCVQPIFVFDPTCFSCVGPFNAGCIQPIY